MLNWAVKIYSEYVTIVDGTEMTVTTMDKGAIITRNEDDKKGVQLQHGNQIFMSTLEEEKEELWKTVKASRDFTEYFYIALLDHFEIFSWHNTIRI
ncbi:hypothetical protein GCK72_007774 [Caenorhabditis remanei]|uniref:Uncharacterized protein n=1 Tax=Caenorhabditis remanei TaxID=31234 RepID=A0A6A5HJY5_CAERE|nr:hypothetical protein GCK72_007774 [Caenorhabditis remanei]KAF1767815.1 hypothetical protein GCK72_007774 [Caenorhabditis remanei]